MPRRREPIEYAKVSEKDFWHPYGLQGLSPSKFVIVTGKILDGHYGLLNLRNKKNIQPIQTTP